MTITDSIKAMPTIADANGELCVSQAAVLALIEAKAEEWRSQKWIVDTWEDDRPSEIVCAAELAGERLSAERGT